MTKNKILFGVKILGALQALLCLVMFVPLARMSLPLVPDILALGARGDKGDGIGVVLSMLFGVPMLLVGIIFLFGFISGMYLFGLNSKARKFNLIFIYSYIVVVLFGPFMLNSMMLAKQKIFLILFVNVLIVLCSIVTEEVAARYTLQEPK